MEIQESKSRGSDQRSTPSGEAGIRAIFDRLQVAARAGKIDDIMALYASDVTGLDMLPPLRFNGKESYRKNWDMFADHAKFPYGYEFSDLQIRTDGNVGFAHALLHMSGESKNQEPMNMWVQYSAGLVKQNGQWLINFEHTSVPIDMESGKGCFDLQPDADELH